VDIEITDQDKNGVMLGKLYLVKQQPNKSISTTTSTASTAIPYASMLLDGGYAWIDHWSEEKGGSDIAMLMTHQENAKTNALGIWSVSNLTPNLALNQHLNSNTEDELKNDGELNTSNNTVLTNFYRVRLSEIYDGIHFAVHVFNEFDDKGIY
jgi:hypothetical protein